MQNTLVCTSSCSIHRDLTFCQSQGTTVARNCAVTRRAAKRLQILHSYGKHLLHVSAGHVGRRFSGRSGLRVLVWLTSLLSTASLLQSLH